MHQGDCTVTRLEDRLPQNIAFNGQFCGVHAFGYNLRRKGTDVNEIWSSLRRTTFLGAGPGRLWERSAQSRQFERQAKFCCFFGPLNNA